LDDIALRANTKAELREIVLEWNQRERLEEKGIARRSKLLFHGPPGCGKSITAAAMGEELGLPTFVIRFDAIIGAYLGQTAIHLRELFNYSQMSPCVLLFDEIDALGKKRGNPLDVGELDRIVIALLQELEHSAPAGLVIATSNLPKHLDAALWRRFDLAIEFPRPTARELDQFASRLVKQRELALSEKLKRRISTAGNYAEAEKLITAEQRRLALSRETNQNGKS
jgi:SpoVK/Ycf46/Vps4 family AAA+-type ATPase